MTYSNADFPTDRLSGGALLRDLDWVQRLAFRLCSDHALAEDLRQEAALAVLGLNAPQEGGRRRWLAGVVRNKLRMKRRSEGRRQAREAGVARAEPVSIGVDVVERAETQRAVTDAILRLREPYRTTVLHRYFDEWTPTEIALRTETSIETVKSRLKRGLRELQGDLAGVFGDDESGPDDGPASGWFSALLPLAVMESKRRALVSAAAGAKVTASFHLTTTGLLLMTAKFSLVPLALLALFGLLLLARSSEGEESPAASAEPPLARAAEGGHGGVPSAKGPDGFGRATLAAPAEGADPKGVPPLLICELSGHVMDDRGRVIEGAKVTLFRPGDDPMATATTGSDGRFWLDSPQQSDPLLELRIEGEWFHASERLEFGGMGWRGRLPLTSGSRDVGTVVLAAAGAVEGKVFDASGAPVAGASVTTLGDATTTSAADGTFRLERVSLGPDTLEVRAEGVPIAEADLTLHASSVTGGVEVQLPPTEWLRGRVVDRLGEPVAGARVELDPVDRHDINRVRSGADGRFEVPFLWFESAYLRVDAEGFDLWDSEEWDLEFEPNTAAIHVALNPSSEVEFSVLDATTGQPIERFGIEVGRGAGSEGMHVSGDAVPAPQDRPGGRVVAGARDEYDSIVVFAEGYEPFRNDVLADGRTVDGVRAQTVRLQAVKAPVRGTIQGRVLRDGAPLANAFVQIEGGIPMGPGMKQLAGRTGDVFVSAGSNNPLVRTAADGTFMLDGLEMPLYRIRVRALGSAAKKLPIVDLGDGQTVDLGDIDCSVGGTVRGQVIMPPGVSPRGLVAGVGYGLGSVREPLDDGGSFELVRVPTGAHAVHISSRDGDFEDGAEADVVVTAGQVTAVQIDASRVGVARVRLRLDLDGAPAADGRILFMDANRPETLVAIAFCDENGRVDVNLPAAGDVAVCLEETLGDYVRHPTARLQLEAGANVQESLGFRFGTAQVAVNASRILPPDGALAVELFDSEGVLHQRVTLEIEDGAVLNSPSVAYLPTRGTRGDFSLDLRRVLTGEWTVKVSVVALDLEVDQAPPNPRAEVWLKERAVTVRGPGR